MTDTPDIEWWGVVDFARWADRPDTDHDSVKQRSERLAADVDQIDGWSWHGEPGAMVVRFLGPYDAQEHVAKNAAFIRLKQAVNVEPGDFAKDHPQRV